MLTVQAGPFLFKDAKKVANRLDRVKRVLDREDFLHLMNKAKAGIRIVVFLEINPHIMNGGRRYAPLILVNPSRHFPLLRGSK